MHIERIISKREMYKMKSAIMKSYYRIKGIGIFALIPVIILYILIPGISYSVYLTNQDMEEVYTYFVENSQYICPLFSVWLLFFILYHLVEQPGCEILYVDGIYKWSELFIPYILYAIAMLPLFGVFGWIFPNLWWLYLKLCVVDLLYASIVYAFSYLFRKIIPGIIVVLLYSVLVFIGNYNMEAYTYFCGGVHTGRGFVMEMAPILGESVVFLLIGAVFNKTFVRKW